MAPRILLADDNLDMMTAVERLLADHCEIVGKVTDVEVIEAVMRIRPDVLILDVHMPRRSGLDVCQEITRTLPGTKVVMLTAETDADLASVAAEAGATAIVTKFSVAEELPLVIKRICGGADVRGTR